MAPASSALALLLAGLLLVPGRAAAQDEAPEQALASIREMVLYAQYRDAQQALEAYLARTDLDAASMNAGLEVSATIFIARRQQRQAEQVLARLFARDPGYRLQDPDPSPPLLSAFGRAREDLPPRLEVTLGHDPPVLDSRTPPEIEVSLGGEGADAVQEVRLQYKHQDDTGYATVVMAVEGGVARSRLPLSDDREAYAIDYLVEALAPSGTVLGTLGSEADPLTLSVPAAAPGQTAFEGGGGATTGEVDDGGEGGGGRLTWLWVTLGVLAVAGGVTAAVLVATSSGGPDDGSLGNIELPLVTF